MSAWCGISNMDYSGFSVVFLLLCVAQWKKKQTHTYILSKEEAFVRLKNYIVHIFNRDEALAMYPFSFPIPIHLYFVLFFAQTLSLFLCIFLHHLKSIIFH